MEEDCERRGLERRGTADSSGVGRGLAIVGMIFGLLAPWLPTAVLPLGAGAFGVLLGAVSLLTGGRELGVIAIVVSLGGMVAGLVIKALAAAA